MQNDIINRVHIGIDFGTSITKVVFRYKDKSSIIYFRREATIFKSETYIDNFDLLYSPFDKRPKDCFVFDYLKMRLARTLNIEELPCAFWLHKNTSLTLKQIAEFCNINIDIVQQIDSDDVNLKNPNPKFNPKTLKILTEEDISNAEKNPNNELKGAFYMPFKKINPKYDIELINLFFLSNVIKETKKKIKEIISEDNIEWYCTIGLPVSYHNNVFIYKINQLFKIAMLLSEEEIPNKLNNLNNYYNIHKNENLNHVNCYVYPEIAAAILGYYYSSFFKDGLHLYFDIGGGTLDMIFFSFERPGHNSNKGKAELISGIIESNGIQAIACDLAKYNKIIKDIGYDIYKSKLSIDNILESNEKKVIEYYKKLIEKQIKQLVTDTSLKRATFFDQFMEQQRNVLGQFTTKNDITIDIFLGGGGYKSKLYLDYFKNAHENLSLSNWGLPRFNFKNIHNPSTDDFKLDGKNFTRFSIAYGLSYPIWERPDFLLPDDFVLTNDNLSNSNYLNSLYDDKGIPYNEDYNI